MNVFNINSSNCVTFEIFPRLKEEEFDLLILFLESKRQSGGGDILDAENLTYSNLEDGKLLKIWYQNSQTAQRVISRKFLKFKHYYIRTLSGSASSFKNESYQIIANKLIIQNVSKNNENDEFIVEMFAEYLAPENEVINLLNLELSTDSYLVTFKDDLKKETIFTRLNKIKNLNNRKINLMDAFNANTLIVFSQKKVPTNFDHLIEKLNSQLANTEDYHGHFIEYNSFSMLVQFHDEKLFNQMFDFFNLYLKSTSLELLIEKVFNFNLVESFFAQNGFRQELVIGKKFSNASVQTDFLLDSLDKFKHDLNENSISLNASELSGNHLTCSETNRYPIIELNISHDYLLALDKNKKLMTDLKEELKKNYSNFELNGLEEKILIKLDIDEWKTIIRSLMNRFLNNHHKILQIPNEILKNSEHFSKLSKQIENYNERLKQIFFAQINNNQINLYGFKKNLKEKSHEIIKYFSSLNSPEKKETQVAIEDDETKFKIIKNTLLHEALSKIKIVFDDFNTKLKQTGAKLEKLDDNFFVYKTNKKISNFKFDASAKSIMMEIEEKIVKIDLEIPKHLRNKNGINFIETKMNQNGTLGIELTDHQIRVLGYKKIVKKFENCIKNQPKTDQGPNIENLLICINKTKIVDFTILNGFNGRYFKEFSILLDKIDATLSAYYNCGLDNGFKILCNLDQSELEDKDKVKKWHQKVLVCRKSFFSKFTRQVIQLPKGKTVPKNTFYDSKSVMVDWKSDSQADIIGEKNEVKRVVQILVKKDKISQKDDLPDKLDFGNPNENTFIINDLKWFQIKILFEEEYFKNLSDNFDKLNVVLNTDLTRICLSGKKNQIEKAKNMAFDILNKIMGAEIECDLITLQNLDQDIIFKFLKEKNLRCVIDHTSYLDRLIVYSTRLQDIEKFKSFFSNHKLLFPI